jgi:hypothetical protein
MNYLFGPDCSCHYSPTESALIQRLQRSKQFGRLIESCDHTKQVTITKNQRTEFCIADTDCISQHRLKNGFELAGRTANDLQHLGCSALLRPRLGKLALAGFKLLFQIGAGLADWTNTRSRLRSGRTKVAPARSALRPLARQGHLVGTITLVPFRSGPAKDRTCRS